MKLASAAFVLLLAAAHAAGDRSRLEEPLSLFRDGEQWLLGYLMFALLLSVVVLYTRALVRAGEEEEAVTAGVAALLLSVVAATPSGQAFHHLCSLALLALLFGHYWRLLRDAGSPWLVPHAAAPAILVLVCVGHGYGYGVWQKGLILYLVGAAKLLATTTGHTGGVQMVVPSRDGTAFAVVCDAIRLLEARTGKERMTVKDVKPPKDGGKTVLAVAFAPGDKELLAVALNGSLLRWDLKTGKL